MRFRTATPDDIPAMVPLINAAYRGLGGKVGWTTEAHLVEGMRAEAGELAAMMRDHAARFELALADDGALLGCVHLRRELDGACYLGMLSVDPTRQAAGVGSALMTHGEALARAWGCRRMRITVLEGRDELLAYYERRGYVRTGRAAAFPTSQRSRPKITGQRMLELEKPLA